MIPKNIFQTHKSLKYVVSKPKLAQAMKSWQKFSKEIKYFFYSDKMCDTFMKEHFSGNVYEAYCKLPLAVMKADLWRYCILYKYGGIYADVDTICHQNPNLFINECLLCIVPENSSHLCQWVFSAPPGSPFLESIIQLSVERIHNTQEIKGEHIVHNLTGPAVFTEGIERVLREKQQPTFEDKKLYFRYPDLNLIRVFNCDNFHKNIVSHLFAGQDEDGWYFERYKKLM
jgi:mannosyltransferase OCH1-like enzyme